MRLELNAVIFITLSLGKLPFISSSGNGTQTQKVTFDELQNLIRTFLNHSDVKARERFGNMTLSQIADATSDSSLTQITNSKVTDPVQKPTAQTTTAMSKLTIAKPKASEATTTKSKNTEPITSKSSTIKPATAKFTTTKSATAKSTSVKSTTEKSATKKSTAAKSTAAIPTTSKPTTKTEVTTIATTTDTIPKQITKKLSTFKLTTTKETIAKASTSKPSTTKSKSTKQKTAEDTTEKATNAEANTLKPAIAKVKNTTGSTTNTTQTGKSNSTNHSSSVNPGSGLSQLIKHRVSFPVLFMVMLVFIVAIYFGYHNRNKINHFLKEGFVKAKKGGSGYLKVKVEDGDYIELPRDANRQYVY